MGHVKDGQTEEKVMHWVNDNLFNHVEVGKMQEFAVASRVLLDKVLASGGHAELTIFIAEPTMLLTGPVTKCYSR